MSRDIEKRRATARKYYHNNIEKKRKEAREYSKQYYAKNPEKFKLKHKRYREINLNKIKERDQVRYRDNRNGRRDRLLDEAARLKKTYGITIDEWNAILAEQDNKCAICGADNPRYTDHSHSSNKVRGILCFKCNILLGHANDSVERLEKAITYLKQHCNE